MRVATWNINSAHILSESGKYDREDLGYIIDELEKIDADVICLQESDVPPGGLTAAEHIANTLGMFVGGAPSFPNHVTGVGWLGQAVLSKTPVLSWQMHTIPFPKLEVHFLGDSQFKRGRKVDLYDRHILEAEIHTDNGTITILNGHLVPFFRFNIDRLDPQLQYARGVIEKTILLHQDRPTVVAGDFNDPDVGAYIPRVFEKGFVDVLPSDAVTHIPYKFKTDVILLTEHWNVVKAEVEPLRADHALCWADIELKQ